MICDISKVRLHLPIDRHQFRVFEPVAHLDQRPGRIAQTQQIAAERVQALDVRLAQRSRQHGVLDRLDLGLDLLNNWHVIVDDEVEDRIDYVILSLRQNGRTGFAALAHRSVGDGSAMADRYDVARPTNKCVSPKAIRPSTICAVRATMKMPSPYCSSFGC